MQCRISCTLKLTPLAKCGAGNFVWRLVDNGEVILLPEPVCDPDRRIFTVTDPVHGTVFFTGTDLSTLRVVTAPDLEADPDPEAAPKGIDPD